jgi:predicted MPP superfamily phosphohydrolase
MISKTMKHHILFIISICALSACKDQQGARDFYHNISETVKPWTHNNFDNAEDKFTFALFSDLTGGERDRIYEVAVAQLNLLRTELIVNVGDLIAGGSDDPAEWHRQWDSFDTRADRARAPVFYTGGNHDLTGEMARDVWEKRLGQRYYHFVYKNVLFLVLDTEDYTSERAAEIEQIRNKAILIFKNEGEEAYAKTEYASLHERVSGEISKTQSDYFLNAIADNKDVRQTFIMMHKPAWKAEGELYFSAIEKALANQSYFVINGHTHVYNHMKRLGRDYINLATTGGSQFPEKGRSMDQVTLVTVDNNGVDIANVLLAGILDKTGKVPLKGDALCFEKDLCN